MLSFDVNNNIVSHDPGKLNEEKKRKKERPADGI